MNVRRIAAPPNKRMKLTSFEPIGRSQLILGVGRAGLRISLLVFSLCVVVGGCSEPLPCALPTGESLQLSRQEHGRVVPECSLALEAEAHRRLTEWLAQNHAGWVRSVVTYVPGTVVDGTGFSINFLGDQAIVNCDEGQFVRSVSPAAYSFLRCPDQ